MPPLRVVSFDSTGTLLRLRARIGATYVAHYQRVASPSGGSLSASRRDALEAEVDARFPLAFRGHAQRFPNFGRGIDGAATAEPWWSRVILQAFPEDLVASLSHDKQQRLTTELYAHYASGDAWRVFDDVRPTLEAMRAKNAARGVRTAVISDFDERLPAILRDLALLPFFDVVVTSWDAGHTKPATQIFEYTRDQLRAATAGSSEALAADEWLHVGDHTARDIVGATAFGAHARLLDRSGSLGRGGNTSTGSNNAAATHVISSLGELLPLVGRRQL